jgi:sulfite exporter TauE/SafE/copper chaperone CopZ
MKSVDLTIKGMHCNSCAEIIRDEVLEMDGVEEAKVDYASGSGHISFDSDKTNTKEVIKRIEKKGYTCSIGNQPRPKKKPFGWIFGILGVLVLGYFIFNFFESFNLPQISQNMGYGLLFVVGLLTGFHCVSMCGGFVVSYTAKNAEEGRSSHKSHLMYGLGKVVSYTLFGALFGLLGSIIAFTPGMRAAAGIVAGLFLILFGLKMLDIFPALRKFQLKLPSFISKAIGKEHSKNSSPLVIGLLNGLMIACGPLQAIYIMAAGTGSVAEGARLLFVFALGTLPVMLGFGYFASFVSSKLTHKILKASGAVVLVLGLLMLNNGLVLAGTGYDFRSIVDSFSKEDASAFSGNLPSLSGGVQEIRMDVTRSGWSPDTFVLKKGVPVKWIINGKEITGCNNAIQVPKLNLKFDIKKGEQVIKFTPTESGIIRWSCWMGMIPGTFIIKDDIDINNAAKVKEEIANVPVQPRGSCGGRCGGGCGGGCGCGG